MNKHIRAAFTGTAMLLLPVAPIISGAAAQTEVKPAPDPDVGNAPSAPSDAQEVYDQVSITQLMKIVELARLIGGGVTQLFEAIQAQTQALALIRDAQIGNKSFPVLNGPLELEERQGGPGLRELAEDALNGVPLDPQALDDSVAGFSEIFQLDKAFAFKDDEALSKKFVAHAAAQGAVAAATAATAYKRANTSMDRLDDYIVALQSSADMKTSVDINTRVMIEVAQQLNESIRTQAALTSVAGIYFMILGGETGNSRDFSGIVELFE